MKKSKQTEGALNRPPKLIRTLHEWTACLRAGKESPALEEQFNSLCKDEKELAAAYQWAADFDTIEDWLEMKRAKHDGLLRASRRKDLTMAEAISLWRACNDCLKESGQLAVPKNALPAQQ